MLKIFLRLESQSWRNAWDTTWEIICTKYQVLRTICLWLKLKSCWLAIKKSWPILLKHWHMKGKSMRLWESWPEIKSETISIVMPKCCCMATNTTKQLIHRFGAKMFLRHFLHRKKIINTYLKTLKLNGLTRKMMYHNLPPS